MLSCHNTDERSETIDINCIPPETSGCDPVSPKNHFSIGLTCAEQSAKNFCKKMMKFHVLNYTFLALSIFVGKCNIFKCNIWSFAHLFQCTHSFSVKKVHFSRNYTAVEKCSFKMSRRKKSKGICDQTVKNFEILDRRPKLGTEERKMVWNFHPNPSSNNKTMAIWVGAIDYFG